MNIDTLLSTHESYHSHVNQADFFYRSYVGGDLYRKGEYLVKYLGEANTPGDAYGKRLAATPLDNHVKTTVDIYSSFIFRNLPKRMFGNQMENQNITSFIKDVDNNGQSMDSFMKTLNDMALVTGNAWVLCDKASYAVTTQAEEEALGIRAYLCAYTPQNVLDWNYRRNINGKQELVYIKVIEHDGRDHTLMTEWDKQMITKYRLDKDVDTGEHTNVEVLAQYVNPLGKVPFLNYAPLPSPTPGVGISLVNDVAYAQKYIYNLLSELEQNIRISGHPSLVKTPSTRANAGAGAIIEVQEDMEPGLKPYLLQPSGSSIEGILDTIDKIVESITRMTHTSAVQAVRGSPMSGIALATERALLNTKLTDISHHLQETEYKIWEMFYMWQAMDEPTGFSVEYAESFDVKDEHAQLELYSKALRTVSDPMFTSEVQKMIAELLITDEVTLTQVVDSIGAEEETAPSGEMEHPVTTAENRADHIREMLAQGMVDLDILNLHPEISQEDINRARNSG